MKVLCTGGRDYADSNTVLRLFDQVNPGHVFVGDCPTGLDKFVRDWCELRGVECSVFRADWTNHGRAAGPKRNIEMVIAALAEGCRVAFAFPGGAGTHHCAATASGKGLIVLEVQR